MRVLLLQALVPKYHLIALSYGQLPPRLPPLLHPQHLVLGILSPFLSAQPLQKIGEGIHDSAIGLRLCLVGPHELHQIVDLILALLLHQFTDVPRLQDVCFQDRLYSRRRGVFAHFKSKVLQFFRGEGEVTGRVFLSVEDAVRVMVDSHAFPQLIPG